MLAGRSKSNGVELIQSKRICQSVIQITDTCQLLHIRMSKEISLFPLLKGIIFTFVYVIHYSYFHFSNLFYMPSGISLDFTKSDAKADFINLLMRML